MSKSMVKEKSASKSEKCEANSLRLWVPMSHPTPNTTDYVSEPYRDLNTGFGILNDHGLEVKIFAKNLLNNTTIIREPAIAALTEAYTLPPRNIGIEAKQKFQIVPTVLLRSLSAMVVALALSISAAADPALLKVTGSIKGPDGGWDYVSIDTVTHRLYVARGYGVMAVDLANDKVTPVLIKGNHVHGVLPVPGGALVSTNDDSSTVTLFKAVDGSLLASFPTGRKPDAIAYDGKTGLVAVMNSKDGTVSLIDPVKQIDVGRITVGGTLEFAEGDGQGQIFVNVKDRNELAVLDIASRKVVARYKLPQCASPTGLALDSQARIALTTCDNAKAVALSTEDGHVIGTLPIGEGPDAVILDAKNKRFLVPCGGNGVLTVIAEKPDGTLTVEGTIPTAKGARTGAIDPATGKVYLPTADFEARKPGEWQGAIVPGSFRILVLSANDPSSSVRSNVRSQRVEAHLE